MKSHILKCRKDTENVSSRVSNTSNGRTMILSHCTKCEAKGLLSTLGIRTPLDKPPLLGDILF